jgi:hypothetical protein
MIPNREEYIRALAGALAEVGDVDGANAQRKTLTGINPGSRQIGLPAA